MSLPTALLLLIALWSAVTPAAAGPVNKCVINGTVSFQQGPCPSNEVRKTPTLEELNAAEKKRRAEAAARGPSAEAVRSTAPAATGTSPVGGAAPAPVATKPAAALNEPAPGAPYRCDGRLYCTQMRSCAEATWFLKHCPGVKMDGNHDGVPCEQQWCRP